MKIRILILFNMFWFVLYCSFNLNAQNILEGKKWVACGDSFTYGDFHNGELGGNSQLYRNNEKYYDKEWNMYKTYPWWIGRRNNMQIINEAICGTCMASSTKRKDNFVDGRYKRIPKDTDYITLWFGINDRHQNVPIGNEESMDSTTFYGAWNVVMEYLIENHPYSKIGIIITSGTLPQYQQAERIIAKRWGIPYLDLENDYSVPITMRVSNRDGLCERAKHLREHQLRVSERNTHPNLKAHELISTVIENFLRSL